MKDNTHKRRVFTGMRAHNRRSSLRGIKKPFHKLERNYSSNNNLKCYWQIGRFLQIPAETTRLLSFLCHILTKFSNCKAAISDFSPFHATCRTIEWKWTKKQTCCQVGRESIAAYPSKQQHSVRGTETPVTVLPKAPEEHPQHWSFCLGDEWRGGWQRPLQLHYNRLSNVTFSNEELVCLMANKSFCPLDHETMESQIYVSFFMSRLPWSFDLWRTW